MLRRLFRRLEASLRGRQAYKFFLRDWGALGDLTSAADVIKTIRFSRQLESLELAHPDKRRIVVLAPHPDDEVLGAGGTIIKALAARIPVTVVYVTSGLPPQTTEAEAMAVSRQVGYETEFLHEPVKSIGLDDASLQNCAQSLARLKPDCIFLPFLLDDHDDHRRVSELFLRLCRKGLFDPRGVEVWAYQVYSMVWPNVVVDVTDVAERKAEAMRLYATQMKTRDWAHYILGLNAFMSRFLRSRHNACYAEGFFVVPAEEYLSLCERYFRDPGTSYLDPRYVKGAA
jgi:LmbE family N-acetylglucosaminyl deacetylase